VKHYRKVDPNIDARDVACSFSQFFFRNFTCI